MAFQSLKQLRISAFQIRLNFKAMLNLSAHRWYNLRISWGQLSKRRRKRNIFKRIKTLHRLLCHLCQNQIFLSQDQSFQLYQTSTWNPNIWKQVSWLAVVTGLPQSPRSRLSSKNRSPLIRNIRLLVPPKWVQRLVASSGRLSKISRNSLPKNTSSFSKSKSSTRKRSSRATTISSSISRDWQKMCFSAHLTMLSLTPANSKLPEFLRSLSAHLLRLRRARRTKLRKKWAKSRFARF